MLGLDRGSAEIRSAGRERRPWPWHRARGTVIAPHTAGCKRGVGVPIGRCPQPGAAIALHLADEVTRSRVKA
jgi:hypothetical protein